MISTKGDDKLFFTAADFNTDEKDWPKHSDGKELAWPQEYMAHKANAKVAPLIAERDELLRRLNEPVILSEWQQLENERDTLKAENERLKIVLRDIRFHLPDVLDYRQFQETVAEDLSARIDAILSDKGAG